jgi:hypothetical protein
LDLAKRDEDTGDGRGSHWLPLQDASL